LARTILRALVQSNTLDFWLSVVVVVVGIATVEAVVLVDCSLDFLMAEELIQQ